MPGVNATLAYSSFQTMEALGVEDEQLLWQNDLALLEGLAHQRHHYGGPTGLAEQAEPGTLVRTFGNSNWREFAGDTLDPREGIRTTGNEGYHRLQLAGPSVPTDNGSPVMTFDGLHSYDLTRVGLEFFSAVSGVAYGLGPVDSLDAVVLSA